MHTVSIEYTQRCAKMKIRIIYVILSNIQIFGLHFGAFWSPLELIRKELEISEGKSVSNVIHNYWLNEWPPVSKLSRAECYWPSTIIEILVWTCCSVCPFKFKNNPMVFLFLTSKMVQNNGSDLRSFSYCLLRMVSRSLKIFINFIFYFKVVWNECNFSKNIHADHSHKSWTQVKRWKTKEKAKGRWSILRAFINASEYFYILPQDDIHSEKLFMLV